MANLQDIKDEKLLNQHIHAILVEVRRNGENLGEVMVRNKVVFEIKKVLKELGYYKSSDGYKLPLEQCKTCKVKNHCLSFKPRSCPNMFSDVRSEEK